MNERLVGSCKFTLKKCLNVLEVCFEDSGAELPYSSVYPASLSF